jgi:hypothetical protein
MPWKECHVMSATRVRRPDEVYFRLSAPAPDTHHPSLLRGEEMTA